MQVTCFRCGSVVDITPSSTLCSQCNANLESLITPLDRARELYQQAASLALEEKHLAALETIQQGLALADTSELHLLAALIHQKLGQFDQMRRHVAAIPVDDVLRKEGEWLLRSHQASRRAAREQAKQQAPLHRPGAYADELYTFPAPGEGLPRPPRPKRSPLRWAIPALALLLVAFLAWRGPGTLLAGVSGLAGQIQGLVLGSGEAVDSPDAAQSSAGPGDVAPAAGEPEAPAGETSDTPGGTVVPQQPTATPIPTATPPVDLVQGPGAGEAVASGDPGDAVKAATVEADRFDLAAYLVQAERPDLARLDVQARRQGDRLLLDGTVPFAAYRRELIDLARAIPGVELVDAINLRVRLPETYTLQEGDTLWTVAETLYGDGGRWEELYQANLDVIPDPSLVAPGTVISVPKP